MNWQQIRKEQIILIQQINLRLNELEYIRLFDAVTLVYYDLKFMIPYFYIEHNIYINDKYDHDERINIPTIKKVIFAHHSETTNLYDINIEGLFDVYTILTETNVRSSASAYIAGVDISVLVYKGEYAYIVANTW